MKFPESEATVARLPTFVHAPALDGINPAANKTLVFLCDEVEEAAPHDNCCGEEAVV